MEDPLGENQGKILIEARTLNFYIQTSGKGSGDGEFYGDYDFIKFRWWGCQMNDVRSENPYFGPFFKGMEEGTTGGLGMGPTRIHRGNITYFDGRPRMGRIWEGIRVIGYGLARIANIRV